jgi:hypothetical protein
MKPKTPWTTVLWRDVFSAAEGFSRRTSCGMLPPDMGGDSQRLTETSGLRCLACLKDSSIKIFPDSMAYPAQAISLASLASVFRDLIARRFTWGEKMGVRLR